MPRDLLAAIAAALVAIIQPVADDPRKLKPGQACRLLNSTPLGTVVDDRRLRLHRQRAGTRIGDGRTIDLLRYAGWLAAERYARPAPAPPDLSRESPDADGDAYERKKDRERRRNAEASARDREVGEIPKPKHPERRAAASRDVRLWCDTYLPHWFYNGWSDDLLEVCTTSQRVMLEGGQQPCAMPRGGGKSTLAKAIALMAAVEGHHKFLVLIGANQSLANELLDDLKYELLTNDRLADDYPEVCIPVRNVGDVANRCKGQTHGGEPTFIQWGKNRLVLPKIAVGVDDAKQPTFSLASGVVLIAKGLTSGIRGMNVKGERPTFALLDDVQTDQSARSPRQVRTRLKLIKGAVRGLAGPGKEVAIFAMLTVVQPDDVADQLLDPKLNPDWQGKRFKLLYQFPKRMDLWQAYDDIRKAAMRGGARGRDRWKAANAFYAKNRKAMDAGGRVASERKNAYQLSGLQFAMDLFFDDEAVFLAEYQNTPKRDDESSAEDLQPKDLIQKNNGLGRGVVPLHAARVTGMIDVGETLLHWGAAAYRDDFTAGVLDYNAWPEQRLDYFTVAKASPKLKEAYPQHDLKGRIKQGLIDLARTLRQRVWPLEGLGGGGLAMELCLVDFGDGDFTAEIAAVCRMPEFLGWLIPSKGFGIGPRQKPMYEWSVRPGEKLGDHWIYKLSNYRVRSVDFDANYWKSETANALAQPFGNRGACTLFGGPNVKHEMLAEHFTSESRGRETAHTYGRSCDVWTDKPNRENHFWDVFVGTRVAASMKGSTKHQKAPPPTRDDKSPPPPPKSPPPSDDDDRARPLF